MAEQAHPRALEGQPDRTAIRRALRARLRTAMPALRVIAEDYLAALSTIDLLAVGPDGELVSIRFAEPGEDAAALTRSLADLAWLRPRRTDLAQLAPGLGIAGSAEPRAILVSRDFGPETRAAAEELPAQKVELWPSGSASLGEPATPGHEPHPTDPASPPTFRTGLVESDLEGSSGASTRSLRRSPTGATCGPTHHRVARGATGPKSDVFRHR